MKKTNLLVALAVTTAAIAATISLAKKYKHKKKMEVISNAGYELAYDIHYPIRYKS